MKLLNHTPLLRFQTEGETKTTKEPPQPPAADVLHDRRPAPTPYFLPLPAATKACSNPTEPRRDLNAVATTKEMERYADMLAAGVLEMSDPSLGQP